MRRWILRLGLLAVAATLVPACGKSRSAAPAGAPPGGGGPPPIGVAVSALQSLGRGGTGATFNGGSGGGFFLSASTGSDVRILRSGTVNSVVNPLVILPNLGTNPRTVSTSQTWTVDTGSGGELTANFEFVQGDLPGDATGLWIQPGVTLTIHPQVDPGSSIPDFLWLFFSNSIYIEGTLRVGFKDVTATGDQLSDDAADFLLEVGENLIVSSTGVIDLSGRDDSAGTDLDTTGGNGGSLTAGGGTTATIVNAGRIDTTGGDGDQGGNGGNIDVVAEFYGLFNSGTVISSGGAGTLVFAGPAAVASVAAASAGTTVYTLGAAAPAWIVAGVDVTVSFCTDPANNGTYTVASVSGVTLTLNNASGVAELISFGEVGLGGGMGAGGDAGQIFLASNDSFSTPGGLFNTGTIAALGGDGTSGGGDGGFIGLSAGGAGAFTSSGDIDSSGGNATGVAADGSGGDAGYIDIDGNGTLRMTGTVTARGGDGIGLGDGGSGNTVEIDTDSSGSFSGQSVLGGMAIGADFDTNGGDGATGGDAGSVDIEARAASSITPGQDIVWIVGFDALDVSGGDGQTYGGDGGAIDIFNDSASSGSVTYQGSIRNEVPLFALGGDGTTGDGGWGGTVDITNDSGGRNDNRSVTNIAAIDVRGGIAPDVAVGGQGGAISMYDTFKVQNTAALNANGGAAPGPGNGGDGGAIQLISDDVIGNQANLTVAGGLSAGSNGGAGGGIFLQGRSTTTTGALNANGANGGANPANQGGWGGFIEVFSSESISEIHGALSVRAGAATVAGRHGQIVLDGLVLELIGGGVTFP